MLNRSLKTLKIPVNIELNKKFQTPKLSYQIGIWNFKNIEI